MSDEYKLELDTALPALRARVKHLGLALADIHDILGVLISWGGVTPLERCCSSNCPAQKDFAVLSAAHLENAHMALTWHAHRIVTDPSLNVALNNGNIGVRDDHGRMHIVWSTGTEVQYRGRGGGVQTIATAGQVGRPTIFRPQSSGTLWVAWVQNRKSIGLSRSHDGGATWSAPNVFHAGAAEIASLTAQPATNSRTGGDDPVVIWVELGNVYAQNVSHGALKGLGGGGEGGDVCSASDGEVVWAAWEVLNPASGDKQIHLSRSTHAGHNWERPHRVSSTTPAEDPALFAVNASTLLLAHQSSGSIHLRRSLDGGVNFADLGPSPLSSGLYAGVSAHQPYGMAVSFEEYPGGPGSAPTLGLVLSTDHGVSFANETVTPTTNIRSVHVAVTTFAVDVFAYEETAGTRTLYHYAGT